MATTPLGDGLKRPSQVCTPGLATHHPSTAPASPPIEGKAEEVESLLTFTATLRRRRARKRDEPGLLWMQGQSMALQPLAEHIR